MKMSKANVRQLGWAAVGVALGLVLYNNVYALSRSTAAGRVLDGSLIRAA
jgi:energy-converting hydrogenase Eha subunit E